MGLRGRSEVNTTCILSSLSGGGELGLGHSKELDLTGGRSKGLGLFSAMDDKFHGLCAMSPTPGIGTDLTNCWQ